MLAPLISTLPAEQMNGFNVLPCLGSGRQKPCVGWEGEAGKHDSEVYRHSAVTSGFQGWRRRVLPEGHRGKEHVRRH